jgi:hexulose-6-phosphate isomerase
MRKGLSDLMFISKWETEDFLKVAKKTGFSGVEFNFCEKLGNLTPRTPISEANRLAHLVGEYGLEITSLSTELFNEYPLSSTELRLRKSGEEIGRRMIEFASEMGVKLIKIAPGSIIADTSYDVAYENAVESLRKLGDEAASAGIMIGVENKCNKFLPSPREFVGFLDNIGHPFVKAYFNTGHALITGYPEHYIDLLRDRIIAIHVNDYRQSINSFVSILEGDTNWPVLMNRLREFSYQGYFIVKPLYSSKFGHERHIEKYAQDLEAILDLLTP